MREIEDVQEVEYAYYNYNSFTFLALGGLYGCL